jgi:hypothetical protein
MGFLDEIIDPQVATRHIEQGSDEWDAIRCGRFTASEMHLLMGSGTRDMTPEELKARPKTGPGSSAKKIVDHSKMSDTAITYINRKVAEALTGKVQNSSYAFPLVYGTDMEPEAVEYFENQTGLVTEPVGFQCFGDHAGGSPDRFIGEDEGLEVKCPYTSEKQIHYLMLTDRFDLKRDFPEIYWQVMSNLLFTGRKRWHLITYDPRFILDKHKMTHMIIEPVSEDFDLIIGKIERAVEEKLKLIKLLS